LRNARARHVTAFFIRIMTGGVNAAGNSGSGLRRGVSMGRGFAALEKAARGMTGDMTIAKAAKWRGPDDLSPGPLNISAGL